jgi:hypothetical protein
LKRWSDDLHVRVHVHDEATLLVDLKEKSQRNDYGTYR